ncbi:MAG: fimbrillin family protein [Rikenellaceae bacterium]
MKKIIIAALAVVAMVSCTKDQSSQGDTPSTEPQAIKFTSGIQSRVDGNLWEAGDKVGIFAAYPIDYETFGQFHYPLSVYSADSAGSSTRLSIDEGYDALTVGDNHDSDRNPLFVMAVYPASCVYFDTTQEYDLYSYKLDVTDQSDLGALDVVSATAIVSDESTTEVSLSFEHTMAMATFNVVAKDSASSLEGARFEIEDIAIVSDPTGTISWSDYPAEYGTLQGEVSVADDARSATTTMMLFATAEYEGDTSYTYEKTDATIKLYVGDEIYVTAFAAPLFLGYKHTFNLSLGTDSIDFEGATIWAWDDSDDVITELPLSKEDNDTTITITAGLPE